jgi:hypothetical protein
MYRCDVSLNLDDDYREFLNQMFLLTFIHPSKYTLESEININIVWLTIGKRFRFIVNRIDAFRFFLSQ